MEKSLREQISSKSFSARKLANDLNELEESVRKLELEKNQIETFIKSILLLGDIVVDKPFEPKLFTDFYDIKVHIEEDHVRFTLLEKEEESNGVKSEIGGAFKDMIDSIDEMYKNRGTFHLTKEGNFNET